jgi:hypothetical protein
LKKQLKVTAPIAVYLQILQFKNTVEVTVEVTVKVVVEVTVEVTV